jgi:hypothetical protein
VIEKREIYVDPASIALLQREMQTMQAATGADFAKVVRNTARDLTFAIIRFTPQAVARVSMAAKGGGFWVRTGHRHTGQTVIFRGTREQAERYSDWGVSKPVRNRGYAKATFFRVLRQLGVPAPARGRRGRLGRKVPPDRWAFFSSMLTRPLEPTVDIGSTVPYIDKLNQQHSIEAKAVAHVAGKMAERSARILQTRAARATANLARTAFR